VYEVGFQPVRNRHCHCCHATEGREGDDDGGENESEIFTAMRGSLKQFTKHAVIKKYKVICEFP
jgi:hypothetical protein